VVQAAQALAPADAKWPATQSTHAVPANGIAPAGQLVAHTELPVLENWPEAQSVQAVELADPVVALALPAAQSMQVVELTAAVAAEYFPEAHGVQQALFPLLLYCPAGQAAMS